MTQSLIALIKSYAEPASNYTLEGNPNVVSIEEIDLAIKQHEAQQPSEDVVERVAKAIYMAAPINDGDIDKGESRVVPFEDAKTRKWICIEQAKAAIAAMGDASAPKKPCEPGDHVYPMFADKMGDCVFCGKEAYD